MFLAASLLPFFVAQLAAAHSAHGSSELEARQYVPPICFQIYDTIAGDTCARIAQIYTTSAQEIKDYNTFLNCNTGATIAANTEICIHTDHDPVTVPPPTNPNPPQQPTCLRTYTSKAGDTCASIGAQFQMTAAEVQTANSFLNCNDIWANTAICITTPAPTNPNPPQQPTCLRSYTTKTGDTCASIGAQFQMTAAEVQAANSFLNCNDIWANTPICITTPAPTNPNPPQGGTCVVTYVARSGDTCQKIATKFGLAASAIQTANSFVNCNDIWANTQICIPSGGSTACKTSYTSKAGDTCATIGNTYGVNAEVIKYWNSFLNCNDIWANTPICVSH